MAASTVQAMLEVLTVDEGFWCRRCLLPSGTRFWFTVCIGPRMTLQSRVQCRGCGGHDVDDT